MCDTDRDPRFIVRQVIHAVRHRFTYLRMRKVVRVNFDGGPLGTIFSAAVFLIAQDLFLLGIDRNGRAPPAPIRRHPAINVHKLRIAIWMAFALPGLAVRVQAVTRLFQQVPHCRVADRKALLGQFVC